MDLTFHTPGKEGTMQLLNSIAEIGGADPGDPLEPGSRLRHLAAGGLLIGFFIWGTFSVSAMAHRDFHQPWRFALLFGLLFAIAVFLIDLTITCVPLKEDTTGYRVRLFLTRGLLSLAIGLVISQSTLLVMFGDALAPIVAAHNQAVAQTDTKLIKAHSNWPPIISGDQGVVSTDRSQLASDEKLFNSEHSSLLSLQGEFNNETECVNGDRAPDGDFCGVGQIADSISQSIATQKLQMSDTNTRIASDQESIKLLDSTISADQAKLIAQIKSGIAADLNNTGLVAQSNALLTLMLHDAMAWLWPLIFVAFDLTIVLMKVTLPESNYDHARRRARELEDRVHATLSGSPEWEKVAGVGRQRLAEVATMRINADADRQIAAIDARTARTRKSADSADGESATQPIPPAWRRWRLPRPARSIRWAAVGAVLVIGAQVLLPHLPIGTDNKTSVSYRMSATAGGSISLQDGEKLTIPVGAISGNAIVTAAYTTPHSWAGNAPASSEVTFSTKGKIVGKPVLSLQVPAGEATAASDRTMLMAFWSPSTGSWTPYPHSSYNPATRTMSAVLTHFSTWRFWTSDFAADLTAISQAAGQWEGRRATSAPDCGSGRTPPDWVHASSGIGDNPKLPVRACLMSQPGSDVLDVELVNNRPYGLMLDYGGATVRWATRDEADTLADGLRNAVGDAAAKVAHGLYLPPLSHASIGIADTGPSRNLTFTIAPTRGTILADALDMSLGPLVRKGTTAVATTWGRQVFAEAIGSCAEFLTTFPVTTAPDSSTVMSLLTSAAPECIKGVLDVAASSGIATEVGLASVATTGISTASNALEQMISIGEWADIEDKIGKVLDFTLDQVFFSTSDLGYGFSIVAS
jgi:hypothetical protein